MALPELPEPQLSCADSDGSSSRRIRDAMENYWEGNFVGTIRVLRGTHVRRPPRFAVTEWNQYHSILDGLARSNAKMEGHNGALNAAFRGKKPPFWSFLDKMPALLNGARVDWAAYKSGIAPKKTQKKYAPSSPNACRTPAGTSAALASSPFSAPLPIATTSRPSHC